MIITGERLGRIFPAAGPRAHLFAGPIGEALAETAIDTAHEIASFLAQVGVESRQLLSLEENLNYSAERLRAVWPRRFDADLAARYARRPEAIANHVYGGRLGNGDEASGDGWRYRGRGLIQVTGKRNYRRCGEDLRLELLAYPELLLEPGNAARSAAWYWRAANLDAHDDDEDVRMETRVVNGGEHALAERQRIFDRALKELTA